MNIRRILPWAALALFASCDRDTKVFSTSDLGTERSTIAGVVTGVGDSGVSGVVVTAQAVDPKGAILMDVPAQTSLSGLGGRFSMELRPGLRWKVSWQSPDYKTPGNGKMIDLGLRQVVDLKEPTRLTYRYGWIVGITTPGATVAIDGQDATTKANDKGLFRLERVIPGQVEVVAIVPGKGYGRTRDSLAAEATDSVVVTTLRPLSSVSGVLTNQDGTLQAGAVVSALGGILRDTTDALGRFHLDNLPARSKVQLLVDRGLDVRDRIVLPTPGEDSTWDLGRLPVPGTVSGPGVRLNGGVVVADSGDIIAIPLLWEQLDSTRTVLGFAWDTTGKALRARAIPTWGPRLTGFRVGDRSRSISVWICVAEPLSNGDFDTAWSSEARINIVVRQDPKLPDSLVVPILSNEAGTYNGPYKIGFSNPDSLARTYWSSDSALWNTWDGDSIVLYDTTTIWAYSRRNGFLDSKIVKTVFDVRPSALPETLKTPIAGIVKLPKGSIFKAYSCPTMNTDAQLVIDTGASLELPSSCTFSVDDGARLELRTGSRLILGTSSSVSVGYNTVGTFVVSAPPNRRAAILSKDSANPMGSSSGVISLYEYAGGSRISGLDLNGSKGPGILLSDVEVDIVDSRLRHCATSGIQLNGTGRPATASGFARDSISDCRWSVRATPYALDRVATNPGFVDTILVNLRTVMADANRWRPQPVPIRVETSIDIQDGASLVLDAGLSLAMGPDAYFSVGYTTVGSLTISGTPAKPVSMRATNPDLGWGYNRGAASGYGIGFYAYSSLGSIRGLDLTGSGANGIQVDDAEIEVRDTRIDSCRLSAIRFLNDGAPRLESGDSGFVGISAKGNHRSLDLTPLALGRIPSNPGLSDTISVASGKFPLLAGRWNRQKAAIVVTSGLGLNDGASLTIEAGNRILFENEAYLEVGYTGVGGLTVEGTAAAPVEFLARSPLGWGYNPASIGGFCLKFYSGTETANLTHLDLRGATANGIVFQDTQRGIGSLDYVSVEQIATPTDQTVGLLVMQGTSSPSITNYTGTRSP